MARRIGIYAGTFNPIHTGHIAFALEAAKIGQLDRVYFLPERRPRAKKQIEHYGHRVAMLKQALKPHGKFAVLELPDTQFTVIRTLRRLREKFPQDQLVFLFGSDVALHLADWPKVELLLAQAEITIGRREKDERQHLRTITNKWPIHPRDVKIIDSFAADASSRRVREAIGKRKYVSGLLSSVKRYSEKHWLYISLRHVRIDKP